jgi:hypothetical protein
MRRPSLFKEQLRQRSRNVAAIAKELASQVFHQSWNRSAIIDVAGSQTISQQLTSITRGQVQFIPKEPPHARFATAGVRSKDTVSTDPFWVTDLQRSRVNEADAVQARILARAA